MRDRGYAGDPRDTFYQVAIATELVLKAFLASRGATDAMLRLLVRHDLVRALAWAEADGLTISPEVRALAAALGPGFRKGGFQNLRSCSWEPGLDLSAPDILDRLIAEVEQTL